VDITTFAHVTALGSMRSDDARSVTLLMDDVGVPMTGASSMRAIAQVMLSPARMTGGEPFSNSNDFVHPADVIWGEASRYYLLGYWPSAKTRELHTIDVTVARKDVHVHARKRRGA
jgi:hypothetical protein